MRRFFFTAKYIAVNNQMIVRLELLMYGNSPKTLWVYGAKVNYGLCYLLKCWVNFQSLKDFLYRQHFLYLVDKHKSDFLVVF